MRKLTPQKSKKLSLMMRRAIIRLAVEDLQRTWVAQQIFGIAAVKHHGTDPAWSLTPRPALHLNGNTAAAYLCPSTFGQHRSNQSARRLKKLQKKHQIRCIKGSRSTHCSWEKKKKRGSLRLVFLSVIKSHTAAGCRALDQSQTMTWVSWVPIVVTVIEPLIRLVKDC